MKGRGEAWREAILAKLRLNVLFPKPPEERCFHLKVAVYGHKVSDLDGDWRPSGPGPCSLPVRALGPEVTSVSWAGTYMPFLPYVLQRGSHICNLFSGTFFARITPHWCANNFRCSIIWNLYHFHQNSEEPLRHPTALSIINPALPPSSSVAWATFNSPKCHVVREMDVVP